MNSVNKQRAPMCRVKANAAKNSALALREYNVAKNRSFGQAAIAFYLEQLEDVRVEQEVRLDEHRRFLVDIVATDLVNKNALP